MGRLSCWCGIGLVVVAGGVAAAQEVHDATGDHGIGTAVYVHDDVVWGYDPVPTLEADEHEVARAAVPATDVHCHWSERQDPSAMLAAMDARNIERAVNLSGGWGSRFDRMIEMCSVAPDRLLVFCNVDFSRIDEADFAEAAVAELRRCRERGAAGLKIFKDLGLRIRDGSGSLVAIDDARLDPIWEACGALGMPVLIHTADPIAFFEPVDEHNERWMQLKRHPGWSYYGTDVPSRETLLAQRDRMIARHPGTTFIGAHMGGDSADLAALGRRLEALPNLVVDMSARVAELGRQPYTARRFFIEYQDRILFGTDRYPGREEQPRSRIYFRFLETDDEYFDYYENDFPPTGEWKIYGLFLPHDVLAKVYKSNADRVLGLDAR